MNETKKTKTSMKTKKNILQAETKDSPQSYCCFFVLVLAVYEKKTHTQKVERHIWTHDSRLLEKRFLGILSPNMLRRPFPATHS